MNNLRSDINALSIDIDSDDYYSSDEAMAAYYDYYLEHNSEWTWKLKRNLKKFEKGDWKSLGSMVDNGYVSFWTNNSRQKSNVFVYSELWKTRKFALESEKLESAKNQKLNCKFCR